MYWRIIWHLQSKHSCCNNTITRRTTESFHLLEKMNFSLAIWQQFLDKPSLYKGFSFPRKNIISILEDNSARLQFSYVAESLKRSMYFPATQQPGTRSPKNIPIASKISSFATSASLSKPTIFHETSTLQPRSPFLSLSLSLSNARTHTHTHTHTPSPFLPRWQTSPSPRPNRALYPKKIWIYPLKYDQKIRKSFSLNVNVASNRWKAWRPGIETGFSRALVYFLRWSAHNGEVGGEKSSRKSRDGIRIQSKRLAGKRKEGE